MIPTPGQAVAVANSNLQSELLGSLVADWTRSLRAANKSAKTIKTYTDSVRALEKYATGMHIRTIGHRELQTFLTEVRERTSAGYASIHYRSLLQFFKWLMVEDEISINPMVKVSAITVPVEPQQIVTDEEFAKLMKVSDLRDRAIMMFLRSTGVRVAELVGLNCDDVDLDSQTAMVLGKGRKRRVVAYDDLTASALSKYLRRVRKSVYVDYSGPELWVGRKGALTTSGVAQMIARRCREARIGRLHPHQFRHTFTHNVLAAGLRDGDVMALAGWSSPQMLNRYGASLRQVRAIEAYRRVMS